MAVKEDEEGGGQRDREREREAETLLYLAHPPIGCVCLPMNLRFATRGSVWNANSVCLAKFNHSPPEEEGGGRGGQTPR